MDPEHELVETVAKSHLPFRAEYCKTGRARCKRCTNFMEADSLKLANMVKSRFHDGHDAQFYHVDCFFRVKRPTSIAEIRHYEALRYEDQAMLEKAIETSGLSILGSDGDSPEERTKRKAKKRSANQSDGLRLVNYEDFSVEYAKSNRAKCNLCDDAIPRAQVRLGKLDFEAETVWRGDPITRWFHVQCFKKCREQLEFFGEVNKIKGFDDLEVEDQKSLVKEIKPMKPPTKVARVTDDVDQKDTKKKRATRVKKEEKCNGNAEEDLLKTQSDDFFALREIIQDIPRRDLEHILSANNQRTHYKSGSVLIDAVTDMLLFGPILECTSCKKLGGFELRGCSYICKKGTEWDHCDFETREPRRGAPYIPDDIIDKYLYFEDEYSFVPRKRLFSSKFIKAVEEKEAIDNNVPTENAPLDGLSVGVISWSAFKNEKEKIKKKLKALGATVETALDKSLFIILSTKLEMNDEGLAKVEVAKELNIPIAKPDFLFKIQSASDVVPEVRKCLLNKWNGDLETRFTKMNVKQLKKNIKSRSAANLAKSIYKSGSVAKSQTLIVKDGTAVDPESGYAEVGKVYKRGPHTYSVVLNSVDVARDKNSFYKMQIIEVGKGKDYILFRSWGRIGCGVGGTSVKTMESSDSAIKTFTDLFVEKTGNEFSGLAMGRFKRIHGLYYPLEIDYSDSKNTNNDAEHQLKYDPNSQLDKPVQDLIAFIFDIQRMNQAMKEFELDAEKMPLGKLSEKHIFEAMTTLSEIEEVLEVKPNKKPNRRRLVALTNKFFTLIPQSFGDGQVQLIDTLKQVEEKNSMLDGLREIEIAYKMCTTIDKDSKQLPIDQHYIQLGCSISTVTKDTSEYSLISNYIKNTHASTHSNYNLNVQEVFKIGRDEDMKRFKMHKNKERALLWHGSRTTNFAGIMSQGLRIAPKEAPVTGYMFGKGIYFADMCSKAANYCLTDPMNNVGLLVLCEVALGKKHSVFASDETLPKNLPNDCDSIMGVGKNTTDPKTHIRFEDDILVPIGKQVANKKAAKSQLLYNEYVVYDESQVMIRYLIRAEFEY